MPTFDSDSLPLIGYSRDQLAEYIKRQLGAPLWTVELTQQQIYDAVNDALSLHGQWRPTLCVKTIRLSQGVYRYLVGEDLGQGVFDVSFCEATASPNEVLYANMIDPAPIMRTGLDEYSSFLLWRKTWQRVMSVTPDYYYDAAHKALLIHNPIERYHCSAFYYMGDRVTETLDDFGARWVKDYALQRAKYTYGEVLSKFSGAVPGPLKDLTLDQGKREQAQTKMTTLEAELKAAQVSMPLTID